MNVRYLGQETPTSSPYFVNFLDSPPDYLSILLKHLLMIWKVSVTGADLVDRVVIVTAFSKILTELGELRE